MRRRSTALAFAALITGALLICPGTAASAASAVETCQGRPATFVGTGPAVVGTSGDDVIVTGMSTVVHAGDGNDLVCVSAVTDVWSFELDAGAGDDVVDASLSNAVSFTRARLGAGRDRYQGSPRGDVVHAEGADDEISTGPSSDILELTLPGTASSTLGRYDGGPGLSRDTVSVRSETSDLEVSLDGEIIVDGAMVADITGFDTARLYAPRAVLRGSAEDNRLFALGCALQVSGAGGDDEIGVVSASQCERKDRTTLLSGGAGNDTIDGWSGPDRLVGNTGKDRMRGRGGADLLVGGAGRDQLNGGAGDDDLLGNGDDDTLIGGRGRDTAAASAGRDKCVAEVETACER